MRCTRGAIYDVVLDVRRESPTYGRWHAVQLSADAHRSVFVPVGCAHGYQTLTDLRKSLTRSASRTLPVVRAESAGTIRSLAFGGLRVNRELCPRGTRLSLTSMTETPRPLVIWGASGHAKVLAEFASDAGFRLVAIFDNSPAAGSPIPGVPLHGSEGFSRWRAACPDKRCGGSWLSAARAVRIGSNFCDLLRVQSRYSPRRWCIQGHSSPVPPGCRGIPRFSPMRRFAPTLTSGAACIVNTKPAWTMKASSPTVFTWRLARALPVASRSVVARSWASGAVILPRLRIGAGAIVGAGAVVHGTCPDGVVVYGNPARIVRTDGGLK